MFEYIGRNKAAYNKGQIFPFLIAVMAVLIILVMITVNMGQISMFKTDVSNAADAGALAGASVLSGALLGFGLRGEYLTGGLIPKIVGAVLLIISVVGIPMGIALIVGIIVDMLTSYITGMGEGIMAWASAKQAALQYAYSNIGVDEPKPTFEYFLQRVYHVDDPMSINEGLRRTYYANYIRGDDPSAPTTVRKSIKKWTQPGFSRFIEKKNDGFAKDIGDINPSNYAPALITTGYGWTVEEIGGKTRVKNCFDEDRVDHYKDYQNWVEVEVMGSVMYPLEGYVPVMSQWNNMIHEILDFIADNISLPDWLEWVEEEILDFIDDCVEWIFGTKFITFGFTFPDEYQSIDDNPIIVKASRHKDKQNLGLWLFDYGTVTSWASGHAFHETPQYTIQPMTEIVSQIEKCIEAWGECTINYDNTLSRWHLFETKLKNAY